MTKQYAYKWVDADGNPVYLTATFVEADIDGRDDAGAAITLPDQPGWWYLSTYGGSVPPGLQKQIDKIMKAAPTVSVTEQVAAANPWDVPSEREVTSPAPSVDDTRTIATLVLAEVRKADDPNFDVKVAALVDARTTLEAEMGGS